MKKRVLLFVTLIILAVTTKALAVIFPLVIQRAIDAGVHNEMSQVSSLIILLCLIGILNGIVDMTDQVLGKKYLNAVSHSYRERITNYILHLEPDEFCKKEKSEYFSIINNNIDLVVNNFYFFI